MSKAKKESQVTGFRSLVAAQAFRQRLVENRAGERMGFKRVLWPKKVNGLWWVEVQW